MTSHKNILVTGAAGYLGSVLVPILLDEGYNVTAYDNMTRSTGVTPLLHVATHPGLKIIKGDVADEVMMKKIMPGHDVILHVAGINGYPACEQDPEQATATNYTGTKIITDNIKPKQKLIFISSGSSYGNVDGDIVTETTPQRPVSLYGETKYNGEKEVFKVGGVILRLATLYGVSPRMRCDLLIHYFCYLGLHQKHIDIFEGHFMRSFVHVRDVVSGIIFALNNYDVMKGEAYHVGDESGNIRKSDIIKMIKNYVPECEIVDRQEKDLEERSYGYSFKKIKALGYQTKYTLADGMKEIFSILPFITANDAKNWRNF